MHRPYIIFFLIFLLSLIIFSSKPVSASTSTPVNATVKISVCGNSLVEGGENCDTAELNSKTCTDLGFAGGTLSCDASCSWKTTSCVAPVINTGSVSPENVSSLLAAGYFSVPSNGGYLATPSLTATEQLVIKTSQNSGTTSITLPDNVIITRADDADINPTTLSVVATSSGSLSGLSSTLAIDGALQWGITGVTLDFSAPITINIFVGTSLNGQTLSVVRSLTGTSGWTSDGIVSPSTCVVASGLCSFQATKASYFATTRSTSSSNSSSSGSSSSSSPNSSAGSDSSGGSGTTTITSSPAQNLLIENLPQLPTFFRPFDANLDGRINPSELFSVIKNWVEAWRVAGVTRLSTGLVTNNSDPASVKKCDTNFDNQCDLKDLSLILYYVNR